MSILKIGKGNPILKEIKDLYKKNPDLNKIIVEDLNSLVLAINNNLKILKFIYCDDTEYFNDTLEIINKAAKSAKECFQMSKACFDSLLLKDNSIGFLAIIEVNPYTLKEMKDLNFILVADHLENPGNLGTIYRTVDSAGVDGVILVDPVTKFNNPKLTLSARGTNLIIPTAIASYKDTIKFLEDNGYTIFLGEPLLGLDYQQYDYKGKIAIIVGNERFGINKDWYNHESKKVFIPMIGHNNSLNVGVAASILIYEAMMKRRLK